MTNVVVKPLVVAYKPDGSHVFLYEGAPVPDYVKGDALKALIAEGFVAKEDATEENTAPDTDKPAPAPVK